VTSGDQAVFALWYFHFALHERPDVAVIADGLLRFDWYRENLRRVYPSLSVPEPYFGVSDILAANPLRSMCYIEWNGQTKMSCVQPSR